MIILITQTMSVVCVFGGGTSLTPNLDNDHIDYSDNGLWFACLGAGLLSPPIWTMIILITQTMSVVRVFGGGTSLALNLDNDHIDYSDNVCGLRVWGRDFSRPQSGQ